MLPVIAGLRIVLSNPTSYCRASMSGAASSCSWKSSSTVRQQQRPGRVTQWHYLDHSHLWPSIRCIKPGQGLTCIQLLLGLQAHSKLGVAQLLLACLHAVERQFLLL